MDFSWISSPQNQDIIGNAVHAGYDQNGSPVYIGRAKLSGDMLVAKVIPNNQAAYVAYMGQEICVQEYEVLVGNGFQWIESWNGNTPDNAVIAGYTSKGEPFYVGRAYHEGVLTPGKIQKSFGCLSIFFNGNEHKIRSYEVLVATPRAQWRASDSDNCNHKDAILGGHDSDDSKIFVGRAYHEGDLIPAKVMPTDHIGYVSHNGAEIAKYEFEMLCGTNTSWVPCGYGSVPPNAVKGGKTTLGETLYIGRGDWLDSKTVGKIYENKPGLYIPYGGSEILITHGYEILIEK